MCRNFSWLSKSYHLATIAAIDSNIADIIYQRGKFVSSFNPRSSRAQKARFAKKLSNKTLIISLKILGILSLLAGGSLIALGDSVGWLVLLPATVATVFLAYYNGELKILDEKVDERSIDGQLDPEILANLKSDNPSALDVWKASEKTEARYFIQNRFMLHPSIFDQLNSEAGSAENVWEQAEALKSKYNTLGYPAVIVVVALLKSIPNIEQILRQAKLELGDIESGISWLLDIQTKRRLASKKHRFGGWARDWTFGYTPILRYLGHNVSEEVQRFGFFEDTTLHGKLVDQIIQAMGSGSSSIALVGEAGTGKTTTIYAFAERILKDSSLPPTVRHHQVVSLDAPSLLAQAKGPGELEQLMIRLLNEANKAKNIILFFDDAYAFFSNEASSVDLSKILQPAIESGGVQLLLALTPKELQLLSNNTPQIASKIQTLQVVTPNEEETVHVLRDKVLSIEYQKKVLFTHQALKEAYRLGGRYVDSQAMPGAALSVLESAASTSNENYITAEVLQSSVEASTGVKLKSATQDESAVLMNLEDELHKYVINQKKAVGVIADALRRSRSGVGNPNRPVGTFLFLGPTGVGKTELSKALARVYFGDEKSMIRVDMNQYVQPEDVNRLITPMQGEQLGLLGQIRKSPFSVVLFDEIEKAHPNVINLLLQTLDEGTMKDIENKTVSFKDSIMIATSNAGADEIRRMIEDKQDITSAHDELVDYIINQKIFAPEFVNRFDEVVVFRPLTPDELLQVIDLIITGINQTLDAQKVQVALSEPAKKWLVEKGYDSRLGARPMRRVAQKYVENILAKRLLGNQVAPGSTVKLDVEDFQGQDTAE